MSTVVVLILSVAVIFPPFSRSERSAREDPKPQRPMAAAKGADESSQDSRSELPKRPEDKSKSNGKNDEPSGPYEVEIIRNVAYRTDKDADPVKHRLDVYVPKNQKDCPVFFFVHGGGWHSGNKEIYAPVGQVFARNGIVAVIVNYRLSPKVKHPAHIEDVAAAFAWTHENISKYGGRPDRIFVSGHSAGGHLVSLLCTDDRYLDEYKLSFKNVRACLSMSGVYAIDALFGMYSSTFGLDRTERKKASPIHHIQDKHPPFLVIYADKDLPTIERYSDEFVEELKKAKCDVRVRKITDRTHISIILQASKETDPATEAMFDFIERFCEWKRPSPMMGASTPAKP